MVSPERKRSCSLLPSRSALASMATKAPPLPGLMCWTLEATQSLPLYSMTLPARMELTGTFMGLPRSNEWNSASSTSATRPESRWRNEAGGGLYQRQIGVATVPRRKDIRHIGECTAADHIEARPTGAPPPTQGPRSAPRARGVSSEEIASPP